VLKQAIAFWKWSFGMIEIVPAELEYLKNWKSEKFTAIKKLEKTVSQARTLFDLNGFITEPENEVDAYDFYIKRGGKYQLWIGIWDDSPTPLSFGYHSTKAHWISPTTLSEGSMFNGSGSHRLWELEAETWDKPEQIYVRVRAFLDANWPAQG